MNDKKKLNSELPHTIRQGEIDAWNRGKNDAKKNQTLKEENAVSTDKAVNIVKMFAQSGDANFVSMKLQVAIADVRKVLNRFNIKSIEDARNLVSRGIIADLDAAKEDDRVEAETNAKANVAQQEERFKEHNQSLEKTKLTQEAKDLKLKAAQEEATRKNKTDRIKDIIAKGLESARKPGSFTIDVANIAQFRSMIPHGISQLQRRFGGSKKDILAEVRRLSPETDVAMLRP